MADLTPQIADRIEGGEYREREVNFAYAWDPGDTLVDENVTLTLPRGLNRCILTVIVPLGSAGEVSVATYVTDNAGETACDSYVKATAKATPWVYLLDDVRRVKLTLASNDSDLEYNAHIVRR